MTLVPFRRRHGRWFDLLAMLAIGVAVVGAALLPAVTANSGETITIRGDVALDGEPLSFFPVGFWTPGAGGASTNVLATTRTDANGGFTLDVPATVDGYAYAGAAPDTDRAIVSAGSGPVIRGIIGGRIPSKQSTPLYQGFPSTTARALNAKGLLHFRLQRPGRIAGTSPVTGKALAFLQVRRLDGSVVQPLRPDGRGRFTSSLLATGIYAVVATPRAPDLPVVATVTVGSGATTTARLAAPVAGGELNGQVRDADGPVGAGVPVLVEQDGGVVATVRTGADGRYAVDGLPAGDYDLEVGRTAPVGAPVAAPAVPIPGRLSTPTPLPTGAPTPTPAATTAALAALAPVDPVSDRVRPVSVAVTVPATLGSVTTDVAVAAAGRITGAVTGAGGAPVQVVVEDTTTHQVLRATTAGEDGRYAVGGLEQGTGYDVWAVSRPADPAAARMGTATALATAGTTGIDVALDRAALVASGSVTGATAGRVAIGDAALLQRTGAVGPDGAFSVPGLVPGALPAVVTTPGRVASSPLPAVLAEGAQAPLVLQPGPRPATVKAWFISVGAGVPVVQGTASSATGDVVRFEGAEDGHVTVSGVPPGTYTFDADGFEGTAATVDGPWWFLPPTGSFSLSDGATTDLGPVVVHVRQR